MSDSEPTLAEVYHSPEFQQYSLIIGEEEAYYYARDELLAKRDREALVAEPLPLKEEYRLYLQTPEWRARAGTARARAGGKCQLCNTEGALDVHHRTYENCGNERPEDLIALCRDCHYGYHRWRLGRA
jgi:5-methylcytosine-specific restriction endonuclease McrA